MRWIIRAYSFVLLAYTGWRTVDFLLSQLPKNDISVWLSIAFLFASEAGLLLWHEISMSHTTTHEQYNVSVTMIFMDFVGSLAAGIADMILRQTMLEGYVIPAFLATGLMYGLPAIMATNVGAALYYLSNDAKLQRERAQREMEFEIHKEALKLVASDKRVLANEKKKLISDRIRGEVSDRITNENAAPKPTQQFASTAGTPRGKKYVIHVDPDKADAVAGFLGDQNIDLVPRYRQNGKKNGVNHN
jgi:hypothetical protein